MSCTTVRGGTSDCWDSLLSWSYREVMHFVQEHPIMAKLLTCESKLSSWPEWLIWLNIILCIEGFCQCDSQSGHTPRYRFNPQSGQESR